MLLTKEVILKWNPKNKEYYIGKGYIFTQYKDEFVCKVEDLSYKDESIVEIQCDYCKNFKREMKFTYYARRHPNIMEYKYKCRECEINEIWNKVMEKCKKLNFTLISDESIYKTNKTQIEYICNKHSEYGVQKVSVNKLFTNSFVCKYCANKRISDFRKLDFDKNVKPLFDEKGYKLLETECSGAKQPLKYICPNHPNKIRVITYDKIYQGQGCKDCAIEMNKYKCRTPFEEVLEYFNKKGLILLEHEYINNITPMKYLCKKHIEKGEQTITLNSLKVSQFGCKYCAIEYRASINNKGGITPLYNYLRGKINQWNRDSIINCNYKCILTGERFDTVHHLYSFNLILEELLEVTELPLYENISYYSEEELKQMEDLCLHLHYKHGLGVCLCKDLHELFHKLYAKGNNIPEQFEEFVQRYKNYEFDDLIKEEYKYKNVKLKEVS